MKYANLKYVTNTLRCLLFLTVLLVARNANATNLRGQLVRINPQTGQYFPLIGIQVNLWIHNGVQWVNLGYTTTDNFGFYYFINVSPNYYFQIQVFGQFKLNPALTVIQVFPPYYQDLPQIAT